MTPLKRPKALADLITLLDETGWSYSVEQAKDSGGAPYITVRGRPAWDNFTEIRATWHSRDTGTLRLFSCIACQIRRDWHDLSLKAARELIQPEPEAGGMTPDSPSTGSGTPLTTATVRVRTPLGGRQVTR